MKSNLFKILLSSIIFCTNTIPAFANDLVNNWQKQGYLAFSVPVQLGNMEPTSYLNAHSKLSLLLIYESLTTIGNQQELQPFLAKSWLISEDNKTITISIKPSHYFSDGTEVTASDVAKTFERACSKKSKVVGDIKGLVGCEERSKGTNANLGLEVINKYKIRFTINCSPTNFLHQLASPSLVITKLTKSRPIGSGPYVLHENNKNFIILNQNPYASKENHAQNHGLVIFYENWDKLPSTIKSKKPDGSLMYKMEDVWNIKDENYNILKINPNITEILVLNNQKFPFNKKIFRLAFSNAMYNHFNSSCIPGADKAFGIIPKGTGGSIAGNPPLKLTEISKNDVFQQIPELKKRPKIIIHQLKDSKNECESKQIINVANQFNVNLVFKYHDDYKSLLALYGNHHLDGFVELFVFKNREAYTMLQYFLKSGANFANVSDKQIDELLNQAIFESSSHQRFQSYKKIAEYIQNEGIVIPLFYMEHAILLSKCIAGNSDNFLYNPFLYLSQLHKIDNCKI